MEPNPPTAPVRLQRALGLMMATAIIVGNVIGSGVFVKPRAVAQNVPDFTFAALVWILGGGLALLGSLSLSEVSVLFPKSGGNYVFLREALGRMFGFLWGWVEFWIIRTASIAALATVVTTELHNVLRAILDLPPSSGVMSFWEERFLTVAIILVLGAVNVRGVRWGGWLQLGITTIKVGTLLTIILLPFVLRGPIEPSGTAPQPGNPTLFTWAGLGAAMLAVQWAYHGWMNVTTVAEEVARPERNIPLATIGGVGLVILLYLGANIAYYQVIPHDEMKNYASVATEFCRRLLGAVGGGFAAAAVMCSAFGALNGNILVGPRLLYAMGQDNLAPKSLSAVHPRYLTPALAIMVEAVWSALLVLGVAALTQIHLPVWDLSEHREINLNLPPGKATFDVLTDFAMFGAVIFETLAVGTIFVFRVRLPNAERPYRCWGYPVVPAVYVAGLTAVAVGTVLTQWTEAAVGLGFIALGAAVYGLIYRFAKR
ncbi:MAG TPA: amino acid permease [Gemmataceae bacterium]|nr:amino acid permease [Gemmataceae bacterium]